MLVESLPDLFCAVGGFIPLLEEVCEGGKVKIINMHALILHYVTAWNQLVKLFVYKTASLAKSAKSESSIKLCAKVGCS